MQIAEVHTLYDTNARAIPDMLRQAAGNIETETDDDDRTKAMIAVQITEGGQVEIYGWGETNNLAAIATLHLGAAKLINHALGDSE